MIATDPSSIPAPVPAPAPAPTPAPDPDPYSDSASDSDPTPNRYQKQYLDDLDDSEYKKRDDKAVTALKPKYKGVAANQNQRK